MRRIIVSLVEVRACAKCGSAEPPIFRHHMGCDAYLGRYNKGIGYNYNRYLDCIPLCLDCHATIHYIYEPYLRDWVVRSARGAVRIRARLIEVCKGWLAGQIKTPKVPKAYMKQFRENHAEWLRSQEKSGIGSPVT